MTFRLNLALAIAADTGPVAKACVVWAESAGQRQRPYWA